MRRPEPVHDLLQLLGLPLAVSVLEHLVEASQLAALGWRSRATLRLLGGRVPNVGLSRWLRLYQVLFLLGTLLEAIFGSLREFAEVLERGFGDEERELMARSGWR